MLDKYLVVYWKMFIVDGDDDDDDDDDDDLTFPQV